MLNSSAIVTQSFDTPEAMTVRYLADARCPFNPVYLDSNALHARGLAQGAAAAGRGNTTFFIVGECSLVLRNYYRGGFVQRLSRQNYVYTGLGNTRAFKEFDLLVQLRAQCLPVPQPFACSVTRKGLFYTASLITHRLPGDTLASLLKKHGGLSENEQLNRQCWQALGRVLARFHRAGVYHADLNAHNILLDDSRLEPESTNVDGFLHVIDFDRGRLRDLPANAHKAGWCFDNLDRLQRSCLKVLSNSQSTVSGSHTLAEQFELCRTSWQQHLRLA